MDKACIWCNKRSENLKQIEISGKRRSLFGPKSGTAMVHNEHEQLLHDFNMRVDRYGDLLLSLFAASTLLCIVLVMVQESLVVVGIYILFVSALVYIFPFATPMTVDAYGIATSVRIVRVIAGVSAVPGFVFILVGA